MRRAISKNYTAMMAVVVLSVLLVISGAILCAFPSFPVAGFLYVISGFSIVGGVWLILRFFMKEEYRAVSNYDFSLGVLLVTAGVLLIITGKSLVPYFIYVTAVLLILLGVVTLQFFLQCAFMRGPFSAIINFLIAGAVMALGICIFIEDQGIIIKNIRLINAGVMGSGILGILSLLMTYIRSVRYDRFLELSAVRNKEDEPYVETYLDVKRSRDRNLEDQPFTVKDLPPEPNPGRPWNEAESTETRTSEANILSESTETRTSEAKSESCARPSSEIGETNP